MRLNVFLAQNGIGSRRKAFDLVKSGLVAVNGKIVREPSFAIEFNQDRVEVEGKPVETKSYEYIILNKPSGFVTTRADVHANQTVFDLLPPHFQHLVPVGRLDQNTEGLLLFTNDGDFVFRLTHPKCKVDKTYFVRVQGEMLSETKQRIEKGVRLRGWKTAPARVKNLKARGKMSEFYLTIHEGRKRQIRVVMSKLGHKVIFLKRVAQGPVLLGNLKSGKWRRLTKTEVGKLKT